MGLPIVVIGAGICGVSSALWLQRSGHRVILIDKTAPGMGASFGNAGLLAQWAVTPVTTPDLWQALPKYALNPASPLFIKWQYLPKLAPWLWKFLQQANDSSAKAASAALGPILLDAVDQHKALSRGSSAESWIADSQFSYAYRDHKAFQKDRYAWDLKQAAGLVPDVLSGPDVQDAEPALGPAIQCLAILKGQGHILNPLGYVTALAKAFEAQGGVFRQTSVTGFEKQNGRIRSVLTEEGPINCDKAVITAGIWSKDLMGKLGLNIPLETERGYHVMFKNPSQMPRNPMMMTTGKFAVTPMQDGLRCAGTVEFGGIRLGPSKAPIQLLRRRMAEAFPQMTYESSEEWMGFRPSTPDSLPLIGELASSGIYTAFGHQHVGLTAGPKTGRLIADLITGRLPNIDMRPYDPARYAAIAAR